MPNEFDFIKNFYNSFKNEKHIYRVCFYNVLFVAILIACYWIFVN